MRKAALVALAAGALATAPDVGPARRIAFADLPLALQKSLSAEVGAEAFPAYLAGVDADTARRLADGEREHLIYYALQSKRFTDRARIEPALSARSFVEGLASRDRERLLVDPAYVPGAGWPPAERTRTADLLRALNSGRDPRLRYFRGLVGSRNVQRALADLYADYVRVARFLYRKEFVAGGDGASDAALVAGLYQSRPHSSDTQLEAGFGVYLGLGTLHALDPAFRVKNALVVGPGLDLAPRTDLIDAVEPQSYQPFAVADALLALSFAAETELRVCSVDVNPRVVDWIRGAGRSGTTLRLFTGIADRTERPFRPEYRAYVNELGRAIGREVDVPREISSDRRFQRAVAVRPAVSGAMSAELLNVIVERLDGGAAFDVIVATNVLTYFDDRQMALALVNIAAMLRPGGYLIHNEARAGLVEIADSVGLPTLHTRTVILAGSSERPLYDVVYLHQRKR